MGVIDNIKSNVELTTLDDFIKTIMDIPDEGLTSETVEVINGMITGGITQNTRDTAVQSMVNSFITAGMTRDSAHKAVVDTKNELNNYLEDLNVISEKKVILRNFFDILNNIFDEALDRFSNFDITLNMTLEEGAHEPTYAHDSDAAADLYAKEDMVLPAHSTSNLVNTGVHIQLPNRWMAMIVPRSSIGLKTGLRLSNSVGIIDEQYLGSLGVIYDNISDSDYTIHAGDRIAQLLIFPSYHFRANIVDNLTPTERGEGGYGSTGK